MEQPANTTCVVVPVYNHPQAIASVCASIIAKGLPCLLVDDGSDEPCRSLLRQLADGQDTVSLLRFETNRGKGAAVCAGLMWARDRGFGYALQVDADGQHDLEDIPQFLAAAAPSVVVTGRRHAEGASALRRHGRKLTDALVWLETLSMDIEDSMCGYRLYPLARACAMLEERRVGQRMDFDTDILVRLYWRGLQVRQVDTRVVYKSDITSHFHMLADNLRITRMHTLLVLGMLLRIPQLLRRWSEDKDSL